MRLLLSLFFICIASVAYSDTRIFNSFTYGLHIPTIITPSLRMGVITNKTITGIEYGQMSVDDYTDGNVTIDDGRVTNVGLSLRYFFSDNFQSLNLFTSLNKRDLYLKTRVRIDDTENTPFVGATYTDSKIIVTAYTASIALGNLWLWDNGLFLGVDWYMPTYVLQNNIHKEVSSNGAITDSNKQTVLDDLDSLCDSITNIAGYDGAIMVTLGYSF